MLLQNPTHRGPFWPHTQNSPSSSLGYMNFVASVKRAHQTTETKTGWSHLCSNHYSKVNESSKRRLPWTTALFQSKGVVREGRGGLFCLSLFSWIENYWLPPVHQSASWVWTLNYSQGMNELIHSRDTHAESKQAHSQPHHTSAATDTGDTPAGTVSLRGNVPHVPF